MWKNHVARLFFGVLGEVADIVALEAADLSTYCEARYHQAKAGTPPEPATEDDPLEGWSSVETAYTRSQGLSEDLKRRLRGETRQPEPKAPPAPEAEEDDGYW